MLNLTLRNFSTQNQSVPVFRDENLQGITVKRPLMSDILAELQAVSRKEMSRILATTICLNTIIVVNTRTLVCLSY